MKYAYLETNHIPILIFCSSQAKTEKLTKKIITPLSQVTRLHRDCATSRQTYRFPLEEKFYLLRVFRGLHPQNP